MVSLARNLSSIVFWSLISVRTPTYPTAWPLWPRLGRATTLNHRDVEAVCPVLHDEAARHGHGAVGLPLDRPGAWRDHRRCPWACFRRSLRYGHPDLRTGRSAGARTPSHYSPAKDKGRYGMTRHRLLPACISERDRARVTSAPRSARR